MLNEEMYKELVSGLVSALSGQLLRVVLYGSVARGTASSESDIDIALFLNQRLSSKQQDQLSELIVDLDLKYDKVISVVDIDQETFQKWLNVMPFYQNVNNEGIELWTAA